MPWVEARICICQTKEYHTTDRMLLSSTTNISLVIISFSLVGIPPLISDMYIWIYKFTYVYMIHLISMCLEAFSHFLSVWGGCVGLVSYLCSSSFFALWCWAISDQVSLRAACCLCFPWKTPWHPRGRTWNAQSGWALLCGWHFRWLRRGRV